MNATNASSYSMFPEVYKLKLMPGTAREVFADALNECGVMLSFCALDPKTVSLLPPTHGSK